MADFISNQISEKRNKILEMLQGAKPTISDVGNVATERFLNVINPGVYGKPSTLQETTQKRVQADLAPEMDALTIMQEAAKAGHEESKSVLDTFSKFTFNDPQQLARLVQEAEKAQEEIGPSNAATFAARKSRELGFREAVDPEKALRMQKLRNDIIGAKKPGEQSQRKLSPTEQKEFFESKDIVSASENVIKSIDEAISYNEKAFSGPLATTGAALNRYPLIGMAISDEAAEATTQMENIIIGQALESLKALFGGMPTEGERKILLDLQASVDKTPKERELILKRAKEAATRRMQSSQQKMSGISTGDIYTQAPQQQTSGWSQSDEARLRELEAKAGR
jgi:hypothetical protein